MKALLPLLVVLLASCTSYHGRRISSGRNGHQQRRVGRYSRSPSLERLRNPRRVCRLCRRAHDNRQTTPSRLFPKNSLSTPCFPWFEPRTAPLRTRDLERLMSEPVVAEKMAEFGVRYMVWLDGFTETSGRTGTISCTVGPGGAGCFGFGSWEDDSTFDARVWDVALAAERRHYKHRCNRPIVCPRAGDSHSAHRARRGQRLHTPGRSTQTICKRRMI